MRQIPNKMIGRTTNRIVTAQDRKAALKPSVLPASRPLGASPSPVMLFGWLMLSGVLLWSYASPVMAIAHRWWNEPDYLHGFLVVPFAALLLWIRRRMLKDMTWAGNRWGLALMAMCGAVQLTSAYFFYELLVPLSLIPCLAGLALFLGGWRALRWAWPAIVFLVFMIPLPGFVADLLSHPLQHLSSQMSLYVIQTLGIPGVARGNVIVLAHSQLGVAEACNGLRMMPLFAAVSLGAVFLVRRSPLEKGIILLCIVPIAVVANVLRIVLTAVMQEMIDVGLGTMFFHELAGWFMMPLAVLLLLVEMALLKRLFLPPRGPEPALLD